MVQFSNSLVYLHKPTQAHTDHNNFERYVERVMCLRHSLGCRLFSDKFSHVMFFLPSKVVIFLLGVKRVSKAMVNHDMLDLF